MNSVISARSSVLSLARLSTVRYATVPPARVVEPHIDRARASLSRLAVDRLRIERLVGVAEFERHRAGLPERHGAVEARAPPGVAGARARLLDLEPDRVLVAVDAHLDDALDVAGAFALLPQRLARAAEVPGLAGLDGLAPAPRRSCARPSARRRSSASVTTQVTSPSASNLRREGEAFLDVSVESASDMRKLAVSQAPDPCSGRGRRQRVDQRWPPRTMVMKRTCSFGSSRNAPVNCVVTVERAGLLDAAQRHAGVLGLDHHGDAARLQDLVDRGRDLRGQVLLRLQAPRIDVDQARELRQADHPVDRHIGDMRLAGRTASCGARNAS